MKLWDPKNPDICDTFWGSHGCDREPGHEGPCICDDRDWDEHGQPIGELADFTEAPAAPPYYGAGTEFFSMHDTPTPPQTIQAWKEALKKDVTRALREHAAYLKPHEVYQRDLMVYAADRIDELESHNQYFRDSPNLAFYHQGLADRERVVELEAKIEEIQKIVADADVTDSVNAAEIRDALA